MKRQLALPGTLRRPAVPVARARKDLSDAAFRRALARHGFRPYGRLTFQVFDAAKCSVTHVKAVYRVNPIRIARRATLAKLIRSREETT